MFEIKHDVPIPAGHRSPQKYRFILEWEVGDCVEGLTHNEKESIGVLARKYAQKTKSRRQEDGSYTVWRVK